MLRKLSFYILSFLFISFAFLSANIVSDDKMYRNFLVSIMLGILIRSFFHIIKQKKYNLKFIFFLFMILEVLLFYKNIPFYSYLILAHGILTGILFSDTLINCSDSSYKILAIFITAIVIGESIFYYIRKFFFYKSYNYSMLSAANEGRSEIFSEGAQNFLILLLVSLFAFFLYCFYFKNTEEFKSEKIELSNIFLMVILSACACFFKIYTDYSKLLYDFRTLSELAVHLITFLVIFVFGFFLDKKSNKNIVLMILIMLFLMLCSSVIFKKSIIEFSLFSILYYGCTYLLIMIPIKTKLNSLGILFYAVNLLIIRFYDYRIFFVENKIIFTFIVFIGAFVMYLIASKKLLSLDWKEGMKL